MSTSALLLSVHPRYAALILSGDKTIELRRVAPRLSSGDFVILYATQPQCAIVGIFSLSRIVSLPPDELWAQYGSASCVSEDQFSTYYQGRALAHGLEIGAAWRCSQQISLADLRRRWRGFHPPQSYRYLRQGQASSVHVEAGPCAASFQLQSVKS